MRLATRTPHRYHSFSRFEQTPPLNSPMHHFTPEAPSAPFQTVRLEELFEALRWQRFAGRSIKPPPRRMMVTQPNAKKRWVSQLKPMYVRRAEHECESRLLDDLRSGELIATAYVALTGAFFRVPRSFWEQRYASLHLSGTILDYELDGKVPAELVDAPIYVLDDRARTWLANKKIRVGSAGYPETLAEGKRALSRPIPSDEKIRRQMIKLIDTGLTRNEAAKRIRRTSGFENVGNAHARRTVEGMLDRGRRPKNKK